VQVYQTKIASIVRKDRREVGDVIAELDRQPVATKIADVTLTLQKAQADFTTAQLDSRSISRSRARTCARRSSRSRRRSSRGAGQV
jgi:hypothetical protein